jgi:AcrR family transcriptional regulator
MRTSIQRAHRPVDKEIRRRAILAGAAHLFGQCRYQDLRMADLARQLGLGKGTLYLYFPTKESLFLAVLQEEMGGWFRGAEARLESTTPGTDPQRVAEGLVREMLDRPLLPGLQALVHGVLEQNVPKEEALAFARFLQDGVVKVGACLERALPAIPPGRGAEFLLRFYSLVIGTQLMSARPPAVREALAEPDLKVFDFTFESVFRGAVVDLMNGMLPLQTA